MNKNRQNKALAAVLATSILVTGTFAWQSFSQYATNETITKGGIAGGRLHDYFYHGSDDSIDQVQQVFVENYAKSDSNNPNDITADIFARVRLSEYMEIGLNAGYLASEDTDKFAAKDVEKIRGVEQNSSYDDLDITDKTTWDVYKFENESAISKYRTLAFGGNDGNAGYTAYLPTYNQDHKDDTADVNGTLAGTLGDRHDEENAYDDYELYVLNTSFQSEKLKDGKSQLTIRDEDTDFPTDIDTDDHVAKDTETTTQVISMNDWLDLPSEDKVGAMWVYDTDGWAYWAQAITPNTATGLLLAGTNEVKTEEGTTTYYAVHAEAQLATAGDWGDAETTDTPATGMYADKMSENGQYVLDLAAGIKTTLAIASGVDSATILSYEGTEDTVTVDGIEYYVLDADDGKDTYTVTTSEGVETAISAGKQNAVLLFAKEYVELPETSGSAYNVTHGRNINVTKFNNLTTLESDWATSEVRTVALPGWLSSTPSAEAMALTTKVTTDGYYSTSSTTSGEGDITAEITYDKAYVLSNDEFLGYDGLSGSVRGKCATNILYEDGSFGTSSTYWMRSAITSSSVWIASSSSGTIYTGSSESMARAVRPVLWVIL